MVLLLPVILLLRFLMRNYEKKYVIWQWRLVYLRSICPIALSSPLCMIPSWNRRFHLLLSELGLAVEGNSGIMNSWMSVYQGDITTTIAFKGCSFIWAAGVVIVLLCALVNQRRLHKVLNLAKVLGENIFESSAIQTPVQVGVFHKRLYLPEGFSPQEMSWLLKHMEYHRWENARRLVVTIISAIHWFNPVMWLYYYLWNIDWEMALDERTVYHKNSSTMHSYAQGLLNFSKEQKSKVSLSTLSVYERNVEKRAFRMMYQKWDTFRDKLLEVLILSLMTIWFFLLVPIQIAWSGGTWGKDSTVTEEGSLFEQGEKNVVAKLKTVSPEGLDRVIQLEMLSGTKDKSGYNGKFKVVMYDSVGNELASKKAEDIFSDLEKDSYFFSKGMTLCAGDYNGDGVQEIVIGQKVDMTQDEFDELFDNESKNNGTKATSDPKKVADYQTFSYALLNVADKKLERICNNIYVSTEDGQQNESMNFEVPEGISDLFSVSVAGDIVYYVWNEEENTYQQEYLTKQDLEAHKAENKESSEEGETNEHLLKDTRGDTKILVSTKKDSTSSEAIQSVVLSPQNNEKKFEDIQGYYCDLFWVPTTDSETERYAMMIYNGTRSQTFIVYDIKSKEVYYQHEDGSDVLKELFEQYNESQISFQEESTVIYNLSEKNEDILKISFAANADDGVTIKGSYEYNVKKKTSTNLTFSRVVEEDVSPSPTASG